MSFALTTEQVLAQTKDVTRRIGWLHLKEGEIVQPVKKCMGLKPGETIERIGPPVRILTKRREPLDRMVKDADYGACEVRREGFEKHTPVSGSPSAFVAFFCHANGCPPDKELTRIEFSYDLLDGWQGMHSAPKDGSEIELLMRHPNWTYAKQEERSDWQGPVRGHWIDFNGGGWCWSGIAGYPIAWRQP